MSQLTIVVFFACMIIALILTIIALYFVRKIERELTKMHGIIDGLVCCGSVDPGIDLDDDEPEFPVDYDPETGLYPDEIAESQAVF